MSDVAVAPELKKLGDEIASLTLKQAILYSFNGEDDGLNGRT